MALIVGAMLLRLVAALAIGKSVRSVRMLLMFLTIAVNLMVASPSRSDAAVPAAKLPVAKLLAAKLLAAKLYAAEHAAEAPGAPVLAGLPAVAMVVQGQEVKPPMLKHPASIARSSAAPDELGKSIADQMKGSQSTPWAIVFGLTLLTLLPAILLSMTPMVRLLVVFHFLRQALGTQTAPGNQVLMGLALMMTWFLMQPVLIEVERNAVTPYRDGAISGESAIESGVAPVKQYMLRYAREKDLTIFAAAGMATRPQTKMDLPLQVVFPAYMLSELKAGFQIGAVLFLPFLLVDLVVASVTTSIGMMQLPPVVISTPLKILLFVMVDGWNLLADQLLKSF